MAKKSHRVAARQAELGHKRKRSARLTSTVDGLATSSTSSTPEYSSVDDSKVASVVSADKEAKTSKVQPRTASHATIHNPYVWPEIKRICMISSLVLVAIVVLNFVIR